MQKIPVIIDCDTGIDDALALIIACAYEKLDIKAITTVMGNERLDNTTKNTLGVMELLGMDIEVARGSDKPIARDIITASYIHGESGLGDYKFKSSNLHESNRSADEVLYDKINNSRKKLTIIALGPLTNIAILFQKHPKIKDKIDKIVFMGGSIRSGNPTAVSTFNVYADPEAAKIVFESGVHFVMCGLDVTRQAYITADEIEEVSKLKGEVAEMAATLMNYYTSTAYNSKRFKGLCLHDPATVAYIVNPDIFTSTFYHVDVETKGEFTTGCTVVDDEDVMGQDKDIEVLLTIDREKFIKMFIDAIKSYL